MNNIWAVLQLLRGFFVQGGAFEQTSFKALTASAGLTTGDARIILVDPTGGAVTVTLPDSVYDGYTVMVINASALTTTITVDGNGTNINGSATYAMSLAKAVRVFQYVPAAGVIAAQYIVIDGDAASGGAPAAHAASHRTGAGDDLLSAPGAIGGTTPAAVSGTVVTATTRVTSPTVGPATGQQHTLPAVTSGTVFVSGASSITDDTLRLGDATHRLSGIGTRLVSGGANGMILDGSQADGASSYQFRFQQTVAMVTGGSCILRLETAAQQALSGVGSVQYGCPSLGQADAFCEAEWITASGAITAGQVVVHSGAKLVAAAAASDGLTTIAGVALTAGTNVPVLVAKRGRVYTNCDAGVTVGLVLKTSGAVAGNVVDGAAIAGGIVGRACESVAATIAGKVLVDLVLG